MGDAHLPALMAALSVALSARTRQLTMHAVDDMRTKAEELLPRDHGARAAIILFCTMYELHARDADAVTELGAELQRGLDRALALPARLRERKDIDG